MDNIKPNTTVALDLVEFKLECNLYTVWGIHAFFAWNFFFAFFRFIVATKYFHKKYYVLLLLTEKVKIGTYFGIKTHKFAPAEKKEFVFLFLSSYLLLLH